MNPAAGTPLVRGAKAIEEWYITTDGENVTGMGLVWACEKNA